jgi:serine/threonine protein kinase
MHKLNVTHKNLKIVWSFLYLYFCHTLTFFQSNVLVSPDGHACVAGLGVALLSSPMPGVDIDRLFHGAAPELVASRRFGSPDTGATKASDVYAFGVLSWEVSIEFVTPLICNSLNGMVHRQIFTGEVPFPDESNIAASFSMWKGRRPVRPDHPEVSDNLWRAIEGCWKVDPAKRKTITEVVAVLEAEVAAHQSRSRVLCWNRI